MRSLTFAERVALARMRCAEDAMARELRRLRAASRTASSHLDEMRQALTQNYAAAATLHTRPGRTEHDPTTG